MERTAARRGALPNPGDRIAQAHVSRQTGFTAASASRTPAHAAARADQAAHAFARRYPHLSAATGTAVWQKIALLSLVTATSGAFVFDWEMSSTVALTTLTLPFLFITALRLMAMRELVRRRRRTTTAVRLPDAMLPTYTLLVPLFEEDAVLPALIRALAALDYPASKCEVILLLEEVDKKTPMALERLRLPGNFRTIVVPRGTPRTKPRALNFGLSFATGSFVAVYDAEDQPEASQLRDAVAAFMANGRDLACLQARLNTYNPDVSFFTRQFTLEYTVLFDGILPALERWRLPLPLGGTSNHFSGMWQQAHQDI